MVRTDGCFSSATALILYWEIFWPKRGLSLTQAGFVKWEHLAKRSKKKLLKSIILSFIY